MPKLVKSNQGLATGGLSPIYARFIPDLCMLSEQEEVEKDYSILTLLRYIANNSVIIEHEIEKSVPSFGTINPFMTEAIII